MKIQCDTASNLKNRFGNGFKIKISEKGAEYSNKFIENDLVTEEVKEKIKGRV